MKNCILSILFFALTYMLSNASVAETKICFEVDSLDFCYNEILSTIETEIIDKYESKLNYSPDKDIFFLVITQSTDTLQKQPNKERFSIFITLDDKNSINFFNYKDVDSLYGYFMLRGYIVIVASGCYDDILYHKIESGKKLNYNQTIYVDDMIFSCPLERRWQGTITYITP